MGLIDIHVLHYKEPKEWVEQCLDSLKHPEVNIHLVEGGFDGSIGKAREYGFSLGKSKYVSFVDSDDYLPADNSFIDICLDELENNPQLSQIYTDYYDVDAKTNKINYLTTKAPWNPFSSLKNPFEILHFHLMRRDAVMPYLKKMAEFPTYEEIVICHLACNYGPAKKLDIAGCYKRNNGQSMRLANDELLKKAIKTVTPAVMKHAKKGLGTTITKITQRAGMTPCSGCLGRAEKLNQLFA